MIATGDLKGSLRKLEACLRSLKYPRDVNYEGYVKVMCICIYKNASTIFVAPDLQVRDYIV